MSNDGTSTPGGDPYGTPDYGQPDYGQQPGGYGQQPGGYGQPGSPYGAPAAPVEAPGSIRTAVLLMRVGALLSLLSLLTTFLLLDEVRDEVERSLASQGTELTSDAIDAAVTVAVAFSVFFALVGVALWLWMAWANGRGRSWARIVATVLFGLSAASFVLSFSQSQPTLSMVLGVVNLVLGAVIVFLLWKRESSEFYAAVSAQRGR